MSDTPKPEMPPPPKGYWTNDTYPVDLVTRADYETLAFYTRYLQREIAEARDDAKSWSDQCSDRVKDWDEMRARAEKAESELADLRIKMAGSSREYESLLAEAPAPQGHGSACFYCGAKCDSFAGNPSKWPIPLCHGDDPGVVKWHHIGCVSERLLRVENAERELADLKVIFRANMLRLDPKITHAEIDAAIAAARSEK
jgi:hypothetical protein